MYGRLEGWVLSVCEGDWRTPGGGNRAGIGVDPGQMICTPCLGDCSTYPHHRALQTSVVACRPLQLGAASARASSPN